MTERVLCVDDEPKVLSALQRQLIDQFDITAAHGADEALGILGTKGPFAVVVSDLRMPGMDGVQLLSEVRKRAPHSVRIMLTGFADLATTVEAVNEGNIFRFLTKPCATEAFAAALRAGIAQYRLIVAEKELLESTLRGSIQVLAEVLSLTNPVAFGHGARVQRLVSGLCQQMKVERPWEVEIAAMLSQIGCVTVPTDVLEKAYRGKTLSPPETQMLDAHPGIAGELIRRIPRLENVARIVTYQRKGFDGSGVPRDKLKGDQIPLGARILKVATDLDALKSGGLAGPAAYAELRRRPELYDPDVLSILGESTAAAYAHEIREVGLKDVKVHSILAEDLRTPKGNLLISKGQEITPSVYSLLSNYARQQDLEYDLRLLVYVECSSPASPPAGRK